MKYFVIDYFFSERGIYSNKFPSKHSFNYILSLVWCASFLTHLKAFLNLPYIFFYSFFFILHNFGFSYVIYF